MGVTPHQDSLHEIFQQDTELLVTAMQRLLGLSTSDRSWRSPRRRGRLCGW
ncbi:hypothetical protein ABTY98_20650 [Streptomyces sp. NPDC096040]|uniref:hypothetical protein n=1 Tax=Streptomyces sp. NPDC096040 TaxID=3155541 RepID=UPI0033246D6C